MPKLKKKPCLKKWQIRLIVIGSILLLSALGAGLYFYNLPAYSHTVVLEDRIKTVKNNSADPAVALQEANVVLGEHDRMESKMTERGLTITVTRAWNLTVTVGEETCSTYSFGETVGAVLDRLQIENWENRRLSHSADTAVYDGMEIMVDHVETVTESFVLDSQYGTRYCYDPTMEEGKEELLFYGIPGTKETFTEAVYINGHLEGRTVTESVPLTEPVSQIVAIGTGEKLGEKRQYPLVGDDILVTADHKCLFYSSVDVFQATGYSSWIDDVGDITACGTKARVGAVAVDPKVIPYFTKMYIVSKDGVYDYGEASAEDCGGAIKGKIIDLFFNTESECWQFGRRDILVYFLTEGQVGEPAV